VTTAKREVLAPISYSRGTAYDRCPRRYHAEYVLKVPQAQSRPLMLGKLIHVVLEKYVKHLKGASYPPGLHTDHQALAGIVEEVWTRREQHEAVGLPEEAREEYDALVEAAREQVAVEPERVVACEARIALTRDMKETGWLDDDVWLRAVVDRLEISPEGRLKVVDYKSGWGIDEDPLQVSLYAPVVRAAVPGSDPVVDVEVHYLRHGFRDESEVIEERGERALRWARRVSARLAKSMSERHWPPTPGPGCRECPVFNDCPARVQAGPYYGIDSEERARHALEEFVMAEEARERVRHDLKLWVDEHGPVRNNGMVAHLDVKLSDEYPAGAVHRFLLDAKVLDPMDYFRCDKRAVDKLARKDKEFEKKVKAAATQKASQRFEVEKDSGGRGDEDPEAQAGGVPQLP